jgi:GH3 auxin-responsive promoter
MRVLPDATPALRVYANARLRRLAAEDPVDRQRMQLMRMLRHATDTRFGRVHGFGGLRDVADYQRAVPLRGYEPMWRDFWRKAFPDLSGVGWPGRVPFLAVSSGTSTGRTKYLPVTPAMVRSNRHAALDVLTHHLANFPNAHVLGGVNFLLGGSTELKQEAPGVRSGDLSGIAAVQVPRYARPWYFPPPRLALIPDWETKIARLAPASVRVDVRAITGTPSWLLLFFEHLAALRPDLPRELTAFYPRLELLVHGGVSFAPYRDVFAAWLGDARVDLREVYPASEGFFAVADGAPDAGLRLILDHGIFFEFVPVETLDAAKPVRHWIADAETGLDYALVVTTCAGLWSYVVGDTVRLVSRTPPRVRVTGRISYWLSAYGEHLTGEEIERGVLAGAASVGAAVAEYSVGPELAGAGRGRHVFVIELRGPTPPAAAARIAAVTDRTLAGLNDDYRAHRDGGQMDLPRIVLAPPGSFAAWMRARGRLGGQNKVPRVITDPDLLRSLLESAQA